MHAKTLEQPQQMFHTPMSMKAFHQYQLFMVALQRQQITAQAERWTYTWGAQQFYSQKAYKHMVGEESSHLAYT